MEFVITEIKPSKNNKLLLRCISVPERIEAFVIIDLDKSTIMADNEIYFSNRMRLEHVETNIKS